MYRESMAHGMAAMLLFLIFLFLLARHMRKMRLAEQSLPTTDPAATSCPPPYDYINPPTYQDAVKMGAVSKF